MQTKDPKILDAYKMTLDSFEGWLDDRKIMAENSRGSGSRLH